MIDPKIKQIGRSIRFVDFILKESWWILSGWNMRSMRERAEGADTRNFQQKYIITTWWLYDCVVSLVFKGCHPHLQEKMGIEIVEPNSCIRGCCTSSFIPLHLPTSSYQLLSPIARGLYLFSNSLFFPQFLWLCLTFLLNNHNPQELRVLFMKAHSMETRLLSRNPSCQFLKTSISFIKNCKCYGISLSLSLLS